MANITPIGQSTPVKDKKKSTTAVIHNQGKLKSKAANLKQCFESDDDDNEEIGQRSAAAESDRSKSKIIYRREKLCQQKRSFAKNAENHSKIKNTSNFIKEVIPGKSHILARIAENPSLHPQTLFCTKRFIRKRGHFPATSVKNPSKFYHP